MKEIALSDSLKKALQEGRKSTMVENQLTEEMIRWVDKLPPLPPGWEYEISPEYMYNPARDCYDIKLTATPRQRYLIKED